jgi:hypothetical protein
MLWSVNELAGRLFAGLLVGVLCFVAGKQVLKYDRQYKEIREEIGAGIRGPAVTPNFPEIDVTNSAFFEDLQAQQREHEEMFRRFSEDFRNPSPY